MQWDLFLVLIALLCTEGAPATGNTIIFSGSTFRAALLSIFNYRNMPRHLSVGELIASMHLPSIAIHTFIATGLSGISIKSRYLYLRFGPLYSPQ
jgi:hypothetical protein